MFILTSSSLSLSLTLPPPPPPSFPTGLEEGGFPFPNGEAVEHNEESKDRTIMLMGVSAQKISVRLKPSVVHKGSQTELVLIHGDGLCRQQKEPGMPSENTFLHPAPLSPCPSPILSRKKAYVKWENKDGSQKGKEDPCTFKPSYQELEQVFETVAVNYT